jgi:hypothetical protein
MRSEDAKDLVRVGLDLLDLVERAEVIMEDNEHLDLRMGDWLRDVRGEEGT